MFSGELVMKRAIALALLAAITGCGGSAAAHPAQSPAAPGNVRVCEHYRTQRAYILGLAEPSAADALKFIGWVTADAAQAEPGSPLARDLHAMHKAQLNDGPVYAASGRVLKDCEALGVKFSG